MQSDKNAAFYKGRRIPRRVEGKEKKKRINNVTVALSHVPFGVKER